MDEDFPYGFFVRKRTLKNGEVREYKIAKPPPAQKKLKKSTVIALINQMTPEQLLDAYDFLQRVVMDVSPEPNESDC
jgi:hypothetical protein